MTPTILVVDDDPGIQRVMTKFLKLEGFTPAVAGGALADTLERIAR